MEYYKINVVNDKNNNNIVNAKKTHVNKTWKKLYHRTVVQDILNLFYFKL